MPSHDCGAGDRTDRQVAAPGLETATRGTEDDELGVGEALENAQRPQLRQWALLDDVFHRDSPGDPCCQKRLFEAQGGVSIEKLTETDG